MEDRYTPSMAAPVDWASALRRPQYNPTPPPALKTLSMEAGLRETASDTAYTAKYCLVAVRPAEGAEEGEGVLEGVPVEDWEAAAVTVAGLVATGATVVTGRLVVVGAEDLVAEEVAVEVAVEEGVPGLDGRGVALGEEVEVAEGQEVVVREGEPEGENTPELVPVAAADLEEEGEMVLERVVLGEPEGEGV